ncbi:MAG: RnfABCDGE type electron transport complex subunit B [Legionellaceae bacterium]|nr:RnfABCDGE type electron transport complex subunit B [Legionellaceae bacterium]
MVSAKGIDALLPQTQCGECGYPGCMPYAQALAVGAAPIDRCPPGGARTVRALGDLLNVDPEPYLDAAQRNTRLPALAIIRESECIGCTKCIQACPVDAIIGTAKLMHTILDQECTGCGLCVEPCPVDCIDMVTLPALGEAKFYYDPDLARARFHAKQVRLIQHEQASQQRYREKRKLAVNVRDQQDDVRAKQDYIMQAMNRVKVKKKHE